MLDVVSTRRVREWFSAHAFSFCVFFLMVCLCFCFELKSRSVSLSGFVFLWRSTWPWMIGFGIPEKVLGEILCIYFFPIGWLCRPRAAAILWNTSILLTVCRSISNSSNQSHRYPISSIQSLIFSLSRAGIHGKTLVYFFSFSLLYVKYKIRLLFTSITV